MALELLPKEYYTAEVGTSEEEQLASDLEAGNFFARALFGVGMPQITSKSVYYTTSYGLDVMYYTSTSTSSYYFLTFKMKIPRLTYTTELSTITRTRVSGKYRYAFPNSYRDEERNITLTTGNSDFVIYGEYAMVNNASNTYYYLYKLDGSETVASVSLASPGNGKVALCPVYTASGNFVPGIYYYAGGGLSRGYYYYIGGVYMYCGFGSYLFEI